MLPNSSRSRLPNRPVEADVDCACRACADAGHSSARSSAERRGGQLAQGEMPAGSRHRARLVRDPLLFGLREQSPPQPRAAHRDHGHEGPDLRCCHPDPGRDRSQGGQAPHGGAPYLPGLCPGEHEPVGRVLVCGAQYPGRDRLCGHGQPAYRVCAPRKSPRSSSAWKPKRRPSRYPSRKASASALSMGRSTISAGRSPRSIWSAPRCA